METKTQICYRGSLRSCNYSCSYCPFSKRKSNPKEWQEDKKALFRFVESLEQRHRYVQAIQIVPYGEALIHDYYWEALARMSALKNMQAVGAQSNASFGVEKQLNLYKAAGGNPKKLRLWLTFHPSMTLLKDFLQKCKTLDEEKIAYCVGVVGTAEQIPVIQELRKALPTSVYLWINKPDMKKYGKGYQLSAKEIQDLMSIDPYYEMECVHHPSCPDFCKEYAFIEADGTVKGCNISQITLGNWYDGELKKTICNKKECSCYLAYCHQTQYPLMEDFKPYPMFRIPSEYLEN